MYHIVVNPQGGKGKSVKALKRVKKILDKNKIEYLVHNTEYAGHATEIVRQLSRTPNTNILVMGGDGSFNEIINGIECFENVTLGLIPCGTGNDFVRSSGHPTKVSKALEIILRGNTDYVDYIQLDDRRCLNVVGAGMDVDVLLKYDSMKGKSKLKYYFALFYTLAHAKFHKLRLTIDDGEPMERSVFMIGIGNGRCIGGGMPICPHATVNDGKMAVCVINEIKKRKILGAVLGFLKGTHIKKPYTEVFEGTKVQIDVLDDSQFEADGEIFGGEKINCKVVQNKLKVLK